MNENMQKWLEALRSGQYSQTTGKLDSFDEATGAHSYCCLGVACDIALKAGVDMEVEVDEDKGVFVYDGKADLLPEEVKNWLGVTDENPKIVIENNKYNASEGEGGYTYHYDVNRYQQDNPRFLISECLTSLNDEVGLSFEQIAQLVEYVSGPADEV